MPYFERKPYSETVAAAARVASGGQTEALEEPSILDLAAGILSQETAGPVAPDGPFRARTPVKAGQTATLTLTLSADDATETMTVDLSAADLRGPGGGRIPGDHVTLSPQRVSLAPGASSDVKIAVAVPAKAPAGVYSGRVRGQGSEQLSIGIEIDVIA